MADYLEVNDSGNVGIGVSPSAKLHIQTTSLGDEIMRLESTSSNGPLEKKFQNTNTTTNSTETTIHTLAIPSSTVVGFSGYITARRTGGAGTPGATGDGAFYRIEGVYKNVGGTVTSIGTATITPIGTTSSWAISLEISSTNVLIKVKGATSNNITWVVTLSTYPV